MDRYCILSLVKQREPLFHLQPGVTHTHSPGGKQIWPEHTLYCHLPRQLSGLSWPSWLKCLPKTLLHQWVSWFKYQVSQQHLSVFLPSEISYNRFGNMFVSMPPLPASSSLQPACYAGFTVVSKIFSCQQLILSRPVSMVTGLDLVNHTYRSVHVKSWRYLIRIKCKSSHHSLRVCKVWLCIHGGVVCYENHAPVSLCCRG